VSGGFVVGLFISSFGATAMLALGIFDGGKRGDLGNVDMFTKSAHGFQWEGLDGTDTASTDCAFS